MSCIGINTVLRIGNRTNLSVVRNGFHTSRVIYLDHYWREKQGLTKNPNSFGPLINLPDYSFKDGRTVPFSSGQMRRIDKQAEYAERIQLLVKQVDHAVERHARLQREAEETKKQIIDSKLKPKGNLLLEAPTPS